MSTAAPPQVPRLSASQILAESPIPPLPELGAVTDASDSTRHNHNYSGFKADTLHPFDATKIHSFRAFISQMSRHVEFADNSVASPPPTGVPHDYAHGMRNEGDARTFLTSLVVDPIRPVILEMLPPGQRRDFDLLVHSELSAPPGAVERGAIPDMAISKKYSVADTPHPLVLVEFKAPHIVFNARHSAQRFRDASPDWTKITRQLRKYALVWKCRHIVLLDECFAFYFYLSGLIVEQPDNVIYCATAEAGVASPSASDSDTPSPSPAPSSSVPPAAGAESSSERKHQPDGDAPTPFTMRELIAFAVWNALKDDVRCFPGEGDCEVATATVQPCMYRPLFPTTATGDPSFPRASARPTRARKEPSHFQLHRVSSIVTTPSYYRFPDGFYHPQYPGITISSVVPVQSASSDSGYHSGTSTDEYLHLAPCGGSTFPWETLQVSDVTPLTRTVFTARTNIPASPTTLFKHFSRAYFPFLLLELRAYSRLMHLQGHEIPYCFGLFSGPEEGWYLAIEYIPYATLEEAREVGVPDLLTDAKEALQKMHAAGVCHGDIVPRNILVDEAATTRRVVFVDLDMAWLERQATPDRRELDASALRWSFRLD